MNNPIFSLSITSIFAQSITTTSLAVGVILASAPLYGALAVGFSEVYAPNNWALTNTNADGSVDTNSAPTSIVLTGGNNGSLAEGTTDYTIAVSDSGTWSFSWLYQTADELTYDYSGYLFNDVFTLLSDGTEPTSNSITQSVNAGDVIGFRVGTADNGYGAGSLTISNFSISNSGSNPNPEPVPEPLSTAGILLFTGGVCARKLYQNNGGKTTKTMIQINK